MNFDVTNREKLINFLKAHKLWLRKESGQHFLIDTSVLQHIVQAAALESDDHVLEIGPGIGTLTQALAAAVPDGLVLAIEKDFQLVSVLREQFKHRKQLKIVHEDALKFMQEFESTTDYRLPTTDWKIVANLPYNIAGQFLRMMFDPTVRSSLFTVFVLMLQKEVVDRLLASPGTSERGILTILRELYGPAERIIDVPKTAFFPVPAVDSALIAIRSHRIDSGSTLRVEPGKAQQVVWLAKLGFAAKRRTLENSLASGLHQSKSVMAAMIANAQIPANARAEDLDLAAWHRLAQIVSKEITS